MRAGRTLKVVLATIVAAGTMFAGGPAHAATCVPAENPLSGADVEVCVKDSGGVVWRVSVDGVGATNGYAWLVSVDDFASNAFFTAGGHEVQVNVRSYETEAGAAVFEVCVALRLESFAPLTRCVVAPEQ